MHSHQGIPVTEGEKASELDIESVAICMIDRWVEIWTFWLKKESVCIKLNAECVLQTVKRDGWDFFVGERAGDLIQVKGIKGKEQYA